VWLRLGEVAGSCEHGGDSQAAINMGFVKCGYFF
jgi:hypothetical protein